MKGFGSQIMPIILSTIKSILFLLFLTSIVLLFNIIVAEGKEISFHVNDELSCQLQRALKEDHVFFKYQPYGCFTVDTNNSKSFIATALGISNKIFGNPDTPIPYDNMDKNRSGYMDKKGQIIIRPKYVIARPYDQYNIAAVADEKEWKYIDTSGKTILKPYLFDNGPDYFKEGLSRYVENNLIGFIDEKYQIVIKAQFEFVTPFHNNFATFCVGFEKVPVKESGEHSKIAGGKWGLINKDGEVVIKAIYDSPIIIENHKAKVTLNGQTFYLDESGNRME